MPNVMVWGVLGRELCSTAWGPGIGQAEFDVFDPSGIRHRMY